MRLCIVQPGLNVISETFIKAHAEQLPAEVTVVHNALPYAIPMVGDQPVRSNFILARGWRKLSRLARRQGWDWEITSSYLALFRRTRPQLVLAEYGPTGVVVARACRLARIPLAVHFHGYDASLRAILEQYQEQYYEMFQQAAAVITVSHAMQRRIIALGAPPEKTHYNPYGVNSGRFAGANPEAAPPIFLTVGRFVEKKGPLLTLRAFAEVFGRFPDARLRMIGEGRLLLECKTLARSLNIEHAVSFLGAQPHQVVTAEMRRSRAFVQHSIEAPDGDCEGTPVAILEAGCSGLPVVATRHAGIPDVVREGETGLLVDEHDYHGMARHMLTLARDPTHAAHLGRNAREHILQNYTQEQSINRLSQILANCLIKADGVGA